MIFQEAGTPIGQVIVEYSQENTRGFTVILKQKECNGANGSNGRQNREVQEKIVTMNNYQEVHISGTFSQNILNCVSGSSMPKTLSSWHKNADLPPYGTDMYTCRNNKRNLIEK